MTEGLLRLLTPDEFEGMLAHELAHIKNRDVLISTLAAIFAGAITWISDALQWSLWFGGSRDDDEDNPLGIVGTIAAIILAPLAALLIQMAISRSREYKADATGARICGNPHGFANTLLKLEQAAHHVPPIEERVARLRDMRF